MVFVLKSPFFQQFFLGNIRHENGFYDILERKNAFLRNKKKSLKSQKIEVFPKGSTHRFGPKMANFQLFFFSRYRPGKCFLRHSKRKKRLSRLLKRVGKCLLRYSRTEKRFSRVLKKEVRKVEKLTFFQRG